MKAAVFYGPYDPRLEDVPVPGDVGPDEVLIKVDRTAICGTDLHPYEGHMDREDEVVLGHEFVGTVVGTGSAVTQVSEGDRCAWSCACPCGNCTFCRRGEPGRCLGLRMFGMGMGLDGVDLVQDRLKLAERLGATGVQPRAAEDAILDLTDWRGADVVVDCVGHPTALASAFANREVTKVVLDPTK